MHHIQEIYIHKYFLANYNFYFLNIYSIKIKP